MKTFMENLRQSGIRNAPGETLTTIILSGIVLLSLLAKLFLIQKDGAADRSILEMEYGFGPVITSLFERGSLEACGVAYSLDFCGVAARMPLMPWLYAASAKLIGVEQSHLAIGKTLVCSLMLWFALLNFSRVLRRYPLHRLGLVMLSTLLFLGPQYLKHAISVQYEESLLIDLFPVYFLLLGSLIIKQQDGISLPGSDRVILGLLILFGCTLYFLKSSLLFFGIIAILAPLFLLRTPLWLKGIAFLPFLLGLLWWGGVNYAYHGQVRLGSSYNGENFYRGQNTYSYQVYPELHLDRLIDSDEATLNDGEKVLLPNWSRHYPAFTSEWEWYDYFKQLGQQWIKGNPEQAFLFTLRKTYVFFVEPRKVPFRQSAIPSQEPHDYSEGALIAGLVWIFLLRVLFFTGLFLAARQLWEQGSLDNLSAWYFLFIGAYAAPYVIGFAYQRHITPMLVFSSILLYLLTLCGRQSMPATPG